MSLKMRKSSRVISEVGPENYRNRRLRTTAMFLCCLAIAHIALWFLAFLMLHVPTCVNDVRDLKVETHACAQCPTQSCRVPSACCCTLSAELHGNIRLQFHSKSTEI